jgi:hypothetical protein
MPEDLPTPAELATMLSKQSGITVTPAMIEADLAAGAPIDADGRMNLIEYVAWLAKNHDGRA